MRGSAGSHDLFLRCLSHVCDRGAMLDFISKEAPRREELWLKKADTVLHEVSQWQQTINLYSLSGSIERDATKCVTLIWSTNKHRYQF
jgi:hypothetical protein